MRPGACWPDPWIDRGASTGLLPGRPVALRRRDHRLLREPLASAYLGSAAWGDGVSAGPAVNRRGAIINDDRVAAGSAEQRAGRLAAGYLVVAATAISGRTPDDKEIVIPRVTFVDGAP